MQFLCHGRAEEAHGTPENALAYQADFLPIKSNHQGQQTNSQERCFKELRIALFQKQIPEYVNSDVAIRMMRVFENRGHRIKPLCCKSLAVLSETFKASQFLAYLYQAAATTLEEDTDTMPDKETLDKLTKIEIICLDQNETENAFEFFRCLLQVSTDNACSKGIKLQSWKDAISRDQQNGERPWVSTKIFMEKFSSMPELKKLAKTPYM